VDNRENRRRSRSLLGAEMADLSITCGSGGGTLKASSEEQLIKAVREHEKKEHGKDMSDSEVKRRIKEGQGSR
jgi:predicted small metal-binding protein